MNRHYRLLGSLYIGLGALVLVVFVPWVAFLGGSILLEDLLQVDLAGSAIFLLTVFIAGAFAVANIAAGFALYTGRGWGRILAAVMAVFLLSAFPFGTALAVYTGWVLFGQPKWGVGGDARSPA